jgi:hypothetical protein
MRPLRIAIDPNEDGILSPGQCRYAIEALLTIAGLPWHFLPWERRREAHITYGPSPVPVALSIVRDRLPGPEIPAPKILAIDGQTLLHFGDGDTPWTLTANQLVVPDILLATYWMLNGSHETQLHRGRWDSCDLSTSFVYVNDLMHQPLVSQWARLFAERFTELDPIDPWPKGASMALVIGHDVDYPEIIPSIETGRYLFEQRWKADVQKAVRILAGHESFWLFEDWRKLEADNGLVSTFYFCAYQGSVARYLLRAPDPFYDITKPRFRDLFEYLHSQGCEIGLHASYLSYKNLDSLVGEKRSLEEAAQCEVTGNRHHYFHVDPDDPVSTARLHDAMGLVYDSSLAFSECSGFRRGTCHPFHVFDPEGDRENQTLQLSPTLMDDHLYWFGQMVPYANDVEHVDELLRVVEESNGVMVVDWHVRRLNQVLFPGWTNGFHHLLNRVRGRSDIYCDTALNVATHWLERARAIEAQSHGVQK